ncbi:hypothetical protein ABZ924_05305 [Streptomyces sp. NPDC046876]|uniref:hypothetical protein n=1 Tax=Streptomyces sp. NPDC046876 TaxID=3155616 RepID=UPI0033C600C7
MPELYGTDPPVRRRLSGRTAPALLALLLLAAGLPTAVGWATGRRHAEPGCRTVAFMSMTGVAPACR